MEIQDQVYYLANEVNCMKHNIQEAIGNVRYCRAAMKEIKHSTRLLGQLLKDHELPIPGYGFPTRLKPIDLGREYIKAVGGSDV